ncbi:SpoIIE family protein phosphatase [Streptomyces fuscichromogenes]|uniref:SpoIIE family protein phosphatase n=1 Tax=Streptomyces fuscichromogenes TaxID=1324013 RepID=UPI003823F98C
MGATREDGAAEPVGPRPSAPASGSIHRAELDRLLGLAVRDTGVLAGALFLLASDAQTLRLEATAGLPAEYLTPWFRVAPASPVPVAEALRERRLVWLSDPQEFARRYPRTAIAQPYHYAAAAAPIIAGSRAWGTLLLFWPGTDHPGPGDTAGSAGSGETVGSGEAADTVGSAGSGDTAGPAASADAADTARSTDTDRSARAAETAGAAETGGRAGAGWSADTDRSAAPAETAGSGGTAGAVVSGGPSPERVAAVCRRLGRFLRDAADADRAVRPGPAPRTLAQPPALGRAPAEALAATELVERLPEGTCSLDLEGRFTYVSVTAAVLLGGGIPELTGTRPWQSLPWCAGSAFEDCYRGAVVSRRPAYFTAMRPPDRWLAFELYPDGSGVSVRISPTSPGRAARAGPARTETFPGEPIPLGEVYQVLHLAAALSEAVGVQDVVDLVTEEILPAFGARTVALLAAEDGRMRVIGRRGYHPWLMDHFDGAPLTCAAPAVRVLATGRPGFFATFEELSRAYPPAPRQPGLHAWVFLPLIASGRPVGSCVFAFDRPHPFPEQERVVFTALAGLVAQALERARLYDASKELAQTLQTALLPDSLPDLPGLDVAARYLPAARGMDIGGDFYDLVRVDDTTATAFIGDVQGHNVTAAALMGRIRPALRTHAAAGTMPAQVLAQANRQLVALDPGRFVSCLYARLDLARHRAVLATAGHPPPILRHPDGHAEVLDLPPGLLLGIDPDTDYPATEIPIPPGTVLALYTDGLVETPGVDLDDAMAALAVPLAEARFQSMDGLAATLIEHARRTAPRTDDIALLLIGLTAAGPRAPGGTP